MKRIIIEGEWVISHLHLWSNMVWEEKRNDNGCSRSHGKFDDDNSEDNDEGQ